MPSIEIVCVGQSKPLAFTGLPFALIVDKTPVSHRGPRPLFRREFSMLAGCTYHFGNPGADTPSYRGSYYAWELLADEARTVTKCAFRLRPEYYLSFRRVMGALLRHSPAGRLFFTTDWQFGPDKRTVGGYLSEQAFWRRYKNRDICLNGSYSIVDEGRNLAASADP